MSFDTNLSRLLEDLKISAEGQQFLMSLGASNLDHLALLVEAEELSHEKLLQHGVLQVPALRLMQTIKRVRAGWENCRFKMADQSGDPFGFSCSENGCPNGADASICTRPCWNSKSGSRV